MDRVPADQGGVVDRWRKSVAKFGESSDLVKCSFCGKTQKQVGKLIAGPGVYICNECILKWPYQNRQVAKLDWSMKTEEDRNGTNDEKEVHRRVQGSGSGGSAEGRQDGRRDRADPRDPSGHGHPEDGYSLGIVTAYCNGYSGACPAFVGSGDIGFAGTWNGS